MSKRGADKYLTDQNWEDEDEPQEAGVFQAAETDVLKARVMKKAKRRNPESATKGSGVFSGFGGLKPTTAQTSSNGFKGFNLASNSNLPVSTFKLNAAKLESTATKVVGDVSSSSQSSPLMKKSEEATMGSKSSEYNRHLSALNKSVSQWIMDHVNKNPLCDLTPIFKDYEKHMSSIDEKFGESQSECDSSQGSAPDKESSPLKKTFGFLKEDTSIPATTLAAVSTPSKSLFSSASQAKATSPPAKPMFAPSTSTASPFKGFGKFGDLSKPTSSGFTGFQFSSSAVSAPMPLAAAQTSQSDSKEDEYVPPKPDVEAVKEDDAFYTKKCKLFYMKEGSYADKGVGYLHLKEVTESKKTQLIVRADTALGNILLNILLNKAIPVSKQGKNNVAISCVPNPPIDENEPDKVVSMLIRVKTSDDADELEKLLTDKKNVE